MSGQDIVASALGPFFLFETKLVRAALEAGVDYISICDDWCAVQDTIIRFDEPARNQSHFVVTGCGVSPGMSNIAVRLLAGRLDRARRADVLVYMPMDSGEGEAVTQHTLFIFGTVVPVFRDGVTIMLPAGSLHRTVEFPRFGPLKVWNIGHGEPVTVPRHVPELEAVSYTHLRAHETRHDLVCRLLLEKKNKKKKREASKKDSRTDNHALGGTNEGS